MSKMVRSLCSKYKVLAERLNANDSVRPNTEYSAEYSAKISRIFGTEYSAEFADTPIAKNHAKRPFLDHFWHNF